MFEILSKVVSTAAKLPIFAKGRGKATLTGLAGVAAGAVVMQGAPFIGGVLNADNLVPVIEALAKMLAQIAAIVAAFGFGRRVSA
jgi:hypothetical protein